MVMNADAKFEGKLTCASKNDMRNLANFHQSTFESLKIWTLMGFFYSRYKKISKKAVKLGSFLHCPEQIFLGYDGCT